MNKKLPVTKEKISPGDPFSSDTSFNQLYPSAIQALDYKHWSPLEAAKKAAEFLAAESGVKILDIGCGVGKFCLAAAYYKPKAFYYGVEQRSELTGYAEKAKEILRLENVYFINGNFTQLNFKNYDHFYFYNSFYENVAETGLIDDSIKHSEVLYNYYNDFLFKQLQQKPAGTRLATFFSQEAEVPPEYHEVGSAMDNILKFWIKV